MALRQIESKLHFMPNAKIEISAVKNREDAMPIGIFGRFQRGMNMVAQGLFYNLLLAAALSSLAILYHHQKISLFELLMIIGVAVGFMGVVYMQRKQKRQFQALLRMVKEMEQHQNQLLMQLREVEQRLDIVEDGGVNLQEKHSRAASSYDIEDEMEHTDRGVHRLFATNQGDMRKPSELSRANEISDVLIEEMVDSAIRKEQIDIFLQPVYTMPQRKMVGYEVYSRIRTGRDKYIPASRYMPIVIRKDILPKLDKLQMAEIMKLLNKETNTKTLYFCNLSVGTLMDHEFMTGLIDQFRNNRPFARQIVFEIPAADLNRLKDYAVPLVNGLVRLGCRFCVDGWRLMDDDPTMLQKIEAHFVKSDISEFLDQNDPDLEDDIHRALETLASYGVGCIVKNIETEKALKDALDFDVKMAQGKLLAEPAPHDVARRAA